MRDKVEIFRRGGYRRGRFVATPGLANLEGTNERLTLHCLGRTMLVVERDSQVHLASRPGRRDSGTIVFSGSDLRWGPVSFGVTKQFADLLAELRELAWDVG